MVIVDANDNDAVWRGPYEDQQAAEKEGLALAAEIDDLEDEGLRHFIAERGLPPTRHTRNRSLEDARPSRRRARPGHCCGEELDWGDRFALTVAADEATVLRRRLYPHALTAG